jgi:hypothetical protein
MVLNSLKLFKTCIKNEGLGEYPEDVEKFAADLVK